MSQFRLDRFSVNNPFLAIFMLRWPAIRCSLGRAMMLENQELSTTEGSGVSELEPKQHPPDDALESIASR